MTGTYILDPDDPTTEATWQAYKETQYNMRDQVAVAYRAVSAALGQYSALAQRLQGGDLAPALEYHVAVSAGLLGQEQALIAHLQAAIGIIDELQTARPGLFPGVPAEATAQPMQALTAAIAVLG